MAKASAVETIFWLLPAREDKIVTSCYAASCIRDGFSILLTMVITKFVCDLLIVSAVSLGAHQQEGDSGAVVDYLGHPLGSEMADIN